MIRVIIESPYAGDIERNVRYARACMADSLRRGEAPFASHLLYTHILRDEIQGERELGIAAGFAWFDVAELVAVYDDLGISEGMTRGIYRSYQENSRITYRRLGDDWDKPPVKGWPEFWEQEV